MLFRSSFFFVLRVTLDTDFHSWIVRGWIIHCDCRHPEVVERFYADFLHHAVCYYVGSAINTGPFHNSTRRIVGAGGIVEAKRVKNCLGGVSLLVIRV